MTSLFFQVTGASYGDKQVVDTAIRAGERQIVMCRAYAHFISISTLPYLCVGGGGDDNKFEWLFIHAGNEQ